MTTLHKSRIVNRNHLIHTFLSPHPTSETSALYTNGQDLAQVLAPPSFRGLASERNSEWRRRVAYGASIGLPSVAALGEFLQNTDQVQKLDAAMEALGKVFKTEVGQSFIAAAKLMNYEEAK